MVLIKTVIKQLPDGRLDRVIPFHVSFEGLEKAIICRDDEDYDRMVKCIFVCARRKNVLVITYVVVSNHAHLAILARNIKEANEYAEEVKRVFSMQIKNRNGESKILKGTDVNVQVLDTLWYLRNALAYIIRNAFDNGATNIYEYKWSGFRAAFCKKLSGRTIPVSSLTKRERENIMHTGDTLKDVSWLLNESYELEPVSACETAYLEQAFNNDQSFFLRCIGTVNTSEMTQKLVISPRVKKTDGDLLKEAEELSCRWFSCNLSMLTSEKKARLLPYIYRSAKTSIAQLSSIFGLNHETVSRLLNKKQAMAQDGD